jgi:hypothetical protein
MSKTCLNCNSQLIQGSDHIFDDDDEDSAALSWGEDGFYKIMTSYDCKNCGCLTLVYCPERNDDG